MGQERDDVIPGLEKEEEGEGLEGVVSAVDKVTHEDVAVLGKWAAIAEQLNKVKELAVNVTADGHRGLHWLHIRLLHQQFLHLCVCMWGDSVQVEVGVEVEGKKGLF